MAAASAVPSLSQIRAWDTYHLADAATASRTTADQWEETFSHVARQMPAPAGIPWEGAGAEGAQLRAHTDLVTVRGMADSLRSASTVAGEGANEIYAARQSVLYAVEDAEGAGFTEGEDLSVISRQTGGPPELQAARQAQAQALAADVRAKAATSFRHRTANVAYPFLGKMTSTPLGSTKNDGSRTPRLEAGMTRDDFTREASHRTAHQWAFRRDTACQGRITHHQGTSLRKPWPRNRTWRSKQFGTRSREHGRSRCG
jgi:hypothetical protein